MLLMMYKALVWEVVATCGLSWKSLLCGDGDTCSSGRGFFSSLVQVGRASSMCLLDP